ncbi:energy-coupling factor transporter ATP-binding protein EcfA2 [Streptomyces syringium]|uniref:Energy-coupling factor transporter ATP-binding protein EcfA2 n=1 Tax=Streptomyces syringium TaxID=76729 RepID=A0ABS4Y2D2_9ACTN|nr:energy-coupling factor transporter ATP-binding protein EcfA2 [Streptomyces syringium]
MHSADSRDEPEGRTGRRHERAERQFPDRTPQTWDDGLIARRAQPERSRRGGRDGTPGREHDRPAARPPVAPPPRVATPTGNALRPRLDALRELVGLSRARLDRRTLAEAGRVLEEAEARQRHSLDLTVVALAGATGSGKSTLFNTLARAPLSEAGVRRPTTAAPVACTWTDRADGLLDRLGIPAKARRLPSRPYDRGLSGLVLLDLPDHDSAAPGHREQVDRLLGLVDAVIWVVDPEKYADAVLHERYLRPLAGYAEVTFVVLNQVDRLSGDAADQVLDDLRRLLDEDGLALGEHGEPGAVVLALSALTGEGVGELRQLLGQFTAERSAAELRLAADVDGASARLRPAYMAEGRPGLTERARQEFEDRLAEAVGAQAAGLAAERAWLRDAERACGTAWAPVRRWYERKRPAAKGGAGRGAETGLTGVTGAAGAGSGGGRVPRAARAEAVAKAAGAGRRGAAAGAEGKAPVAGPASGAGRLPDSVSGSASRSVSFPGPDSGAGADASPASRADAGLVPGAAAGRTRRAGAEESATGVPGGAPAGTSGVPGIPASSRRTASRPLVEQAVRTLAYEASVGLPGPWAQAVREAAGRGTEQVAQALDEAASAAATATRPPRPRWWAVVAVVQVALLVVQLAGMAWLTGAVTGVFGGEWWAPGLLITAGGVGGPILAWGCRLAARGPARGHGAETERRLRGAAAGCGRARVLEPVVAELLRYREVRTQFVIVAGEAQT